MSPKQNAAFTASLFLAAAVQAFGAASASPPHASLTHHNGRVARNASLKAAPPKTVRWNPTKPARAVDLDEEPYAVFVPDGDSVKLIAQSPTIKVDEVRALASHVKLLTVSCALDAMHQHPNLKTPENLALIRQGMLESNNRAMDSLLVAISPDGTREGGLALLRAKKATLNLSSYFDVENASGDPTPLKKGDIRHDLFGTLQDVAKFAADLFGNKEKREILEQAAYSDIRQVDKPTNYVFWKGDGVLLATKTATANGAGFRTMISFYNDGQNTFYIIHPNSYSNKQAPSSTMSSIIDQVLHQQGAAEPPRFADWLHVMEQKQFPRVKDAIAELAIRSQLTLEQTMARFSAPALPKSHVKSHYSRAREVALVRMRPH